MQRPLVWLAAAALAISGWLPALAQSPATAPAPAAPAIGVTVPATGSVASVPGLAELLERALLSDPQVRVAQAQLKAAGNRILQFRSRFAPIFGLQTSYGQGADAEFGTPIDRTVERAEATLRWNLYNGGSDRVELDAGQREIEASVQDLNRAREEVSQTIAESAIELWRIDAQLLLAQERLEAVRRLAQQVAVQAELGRLSDADLQQATASLVEAEIALDQLRADRVGVIDRLGTLLGEPVQGVRPMLLPVAAAGDVPASLRSARLRAQGARLRVRTLLDAHAPRVDLDVRKRLSDRTSPALTTEQKRNWSVTVRWEVPLGGELGYRRDEVERRAEAAEAEVERLERQLLAELAAIGPRITGGERAVLLLDRQVEQLAAIVRAAELQFDAGRRSLQQLIQAHEARFLAQQRRTDQQSRVQVTRLRQLLLTGGLLPALGQDPAVPLSLR